MTVAQELFAGQTLHSAAAVQELPPGTVIVWADPDCLEDETVAIVEEWETGPGRMLSHSGSAYWLSDPADLVGERSFTVLRAGRR